MEAGHEYAELLAVDPAVAVAHQLNRHGVDACVARVLARRKGRQLSIVGAGEILVDVSDLRRHQVEVVEEPFCCCGDKLPGPDVIGQGAVGVAQHAGVVIEPGEDVPGPAPGARVGDEARGEGQPALFQSLDAEQLVPKGLLG